MVEIHCCKAWDIEYFGYLQGQTSTFFSTTYIQIFVYCHTLKKKKKPVNHCNEVPTPELITLKLFHSDGMRTYIFVWYLYAKYSNLKWFDPFLTTKTLLNTINARLFFLNFIKFNRSKKMYGYYNILYTFFHCLNK